MNLIFDIDNTIYFRDDKKATSEILECLIQLGKKYNLYFATRREQYNLEPIDELIKSGLVKNVFCANGAYDLNNELSTSFLNNSDKLTNYLKANNYHYLLETNQGIVINKSGRLYQMEDFYNKKYLENTNQIDQVASILICSSKNEKLEQLFQMHDCSYIYNEHYENYSIANPLATKEQMINKAVKDDYICFGDSLLDDLMMIKNAKQGYLIEQETSGIVTIDRRKLITVLKELL